MLKKLLFITLLLFHVTTHADPAADALNQLLKNIHSMKADFTQTMTDNKGKLIQKSQGNMGLQRPGKFRWETTSPMKQLVVATGTRLWIYDPDLEQVVVKVLSKQAGQTPALLLSDANPALETDFTVKSTLKADKQWFTLLPKDESSLFTSIRMGFVGEQLAEMQLKDHLDHTTVIQFQHIKFNQPLPAALFYFAPPKNVDVIDETKT